MLVPGGQTYRLQFAFHDDTTDRGSRQQTVDALLLPGGRYLIQFFVDATSPTLALNPMVYFWIVETKTAQTIAGTEPPSKHLIDEMQERQNQELARRGQASTESYMDPIVKHFESYLRAL